MVVQVVKLGQPYPVVLLLQLLEDFLLKTFLVDHGGSDVLGAHRFPHLDFVFFFKLEHQLLIVETPLEGIFIQSGNHILQVRIRILPLYLVLSFRRLLHLLLVLRILFGSLLVQPIKGHLSFFFSHNVVDPFLLICTSLVQIFKGLLPQSVNFVVHRLPELHHFWVELVRTSVSALEEPLALIKGDPFIDIGAEGAALALFFELLLFIFVL